MRGMPDITAATLMALLGLYYLIIVRGNYVLKVLCIKVRTVHTQLHLLASQDTFSVEVFCSAVSLQNDNLYHLIRFQVQAWPLLVFMHGTGRAASET